jgi:hypothetical protein
MATLDALRTQQPSPRIAKASSLRSGDAQDVHGHARPENTKSGSENVTNCLDGDSGRETRWKLTQAIATADASRHSLWKVAAAGVLTGILTPLLPPLLDNTHLAPAGIVLAAVPFAVLVLVLVRRRSANPAWAAPIAAVVTMIAFVCAVNAAIWIDVRADDAAKVVRNILAGLAGGFTGATLMALGIGLLPAGPRAITAWWPMSLTGTVAGVLFALDDGLGLDMTSVMYPVWQAGISVQLAVALGRTRRYATAR